MRIGSIVIHCREFDRMVKFWQETLRYIPRHRRRTAGLSCAIPRARVQICRSRPAIPVRLTAVGFTSTFSRPLGTKKSIDWCRSELAVIRRRIVPVLISSFWKTQMAISSACSGQQLPCRQASNDDFRPNHSLSPPAVIQTAVRLGF